LEHHVLLHGVLPVCESSIIYRSG